MDSRCDNLKSPQFRGNSYALQNTVPMYHPSGMDFRVQKEEKVENNKLMQKDVLVLIFLLQKNPLQSCHELQLFHHLEIQCLLDRPTTMVSCDGLNESLM